MGHDYGLWEQDQKSSDLVAPRYLLNSSSFKADTLAVFFTWSNRPTAIT